MISLPPNEVERRFALLGIPNRFTEDEKQRLTTGLVPSDHGTSVSLSSIIGFATPVERSGLNILNLKAICGTDPSQQPSFFDHPWYREELFAREDCAPGWHLLLMDVLPESILQPINYARSLQSRGLELPSAVEVALMLFLHYAGTGEQLLQKKHTWCKDQASMNRFVTVGAFGRNGLFVSGHPGEFMSRGLGICAKITN